MTAQEIKRYSSQCLLLTNSHQIMLLLLVSYLSGESR